jgi:hypothetical protein
MDIVFNKLKKAVEYIKNDDASPIAGTVDSDRPLSEDPGESFGVLSSHYQ